MQKISKKEFRKFKDAEYFKKEKLAPHNIVFAVKDEDLDQVHNW